MKNPVQAGAEDENRVGFFKSSTSSASGIEGVRVWEYPFAHWRGEEGESRVFD